MLNRRPSALADARPKRLRREALSTPDVSCDVWPVARRTALEMARFGGFTLDTRRRVLLAHGKPIALHARAFDLLAFLIEHRERAVTHAEILAHVWENRIVAENNLSVQLSSLRKALADTGCAETLIVTLPGRRYQFVGAVLADDEAAPPAAAPAPPVPVAASLPPPAPMPVPALVEKRSRRPLALAAAAASVLAGLACWLFWPAPPRAPLLSIAVLPFRNASADRGQDYLADAITDDLIADLAHIPASTVIARASADAVQHEPPQRIGAALHVRYILAGTLAPEGDSYHVVAALTDAVTARQLWSAQFDPKRDRIADLRQDIVRRIASPLHVALDELENARSLRDRPDDPAAIDLFFRARSVLDSGATLRRFEAAQSLLQRALQKQPDFIDASAALAWTLLLKVTLTDDPNDKADFDQAKALVAHVLTVSPQNVEALSAHAKLRQMNGDCAGAREDADRVLAMEPSNMKVRSVLGGCDQDELRLDQAASDYESLLRLDPANPNAALRVITLGTIRLVQGDNQKAVSLLSRGVEREAAPSADLEPAEQAELMLIAAMDRAGDRQRAQAAYAAYAGRFHNRTVWRISRYFRRSWQHDAGLWRALEGLRDAGMPMFAGERDAAIENGAPCADGDFAPTPLHLPKGGRVLDTAALLAVRRRGANMLILDMGRGIDAPSDWVVYDAASGADDAMAFASRVVGQQDAAGRGRDVVVLGDGVTGCLAYTVSVHLIDLGFTRVSWYRGGEEAWHRHAIAGATIGADRAGAVAAH